MQIKWDRLKWQMLQIQWDGGSIYFVFLIPMVNKNHGDWL